jgi:hypothetical protein
MAVVNRIDRRANSCSLAVEPLMNPNNEEVPVLKGYVYQLTGGHSADARGMAYKYGPVLAPLCGGSG